MADTKVSLKLLIDAKDGKVLFAEAGKEFVDFLFNILSMPIATVIRIITTKDMVGSLGNLYKSIENLNSTFMQPNQVRETLLKPKIANSSIKTPLLLPTIASATPTFYRCPRSQESRTNSCRGYVSNDASTVCPSCKGCMSFTVELVNPPHPKLYSNEVGFVKGVVTYMVMDDLVITPMSTISGITMLNKFNIKDVGSLQEKVVNVSIDEGVNLLKASLQTKQVLTHVFLKNKPKTEN